jgi:hypothetical protein
VPIGIDIRDKKLVFKWQNKDISRGFGITVLGGKSRQDFEELFIGTVRFTQFFF